MASRRPSRALTTIVVHPRTIEFHQLTSEEIDQLAEGGRSINLTLAAALLGALISLVSLRVALDIASPATAATVVAAIITCGVLLVFFSVGAFRDHQKTKTMANEFKEKNSRA